MRPHVITCGNGPGTVEAGPATPGFNEAARDHVRKYFVLQCRKLKESGFNEAARDHVRKYFVLQCRKLKESGFNEAARDHVRKCRYPATVPLFRTRFNE